jgi:SAM-dependent methyltransferase
MEAEDYSYLYELEEDFWWFVGMREITAALLDPVCPPTRDRLILDAGCGTGGMLSWLTRYAGNGRVMGVDLVRTALEFCREREHRSLAQASVVNLPFADSSFDLLTSFDVLVQLPGAKADELAMREIERVLRPGGIVFVRVAAYKWMSSSHDEALGTQRRYHLSELVKKMEQAGFNVLRATYANALLLPAAMVRRLLLKRIRLASPGSDVKPLSPRLGWLNRALADVLRIESWLLRLTRSELPVGLSAICVAEKPVG